MSDQWYYRTRDQILGPVPGAALRQMITSGTLRPNDLISHDRDSWLRVSESPFADDVTSAVAESSATPPQPGRSAGVMPSKEVRSAIAESNRYLHQRDARLARQTETRYRRLIRLPWPDWSRMLEWPAALVNASIAITGHVLTWLIGAVGPLVHSRLTWGGLAILIVTYVAYALPASVLTRSEVRTFLDRTVTELRRLRTVQADEEQWDVFARTTREELREIIPQLEQSASTDDQASIEYLYLARDFLPKMLDDAREQPSAAERKFNIHMDRVERVYAREPSWIDRLPHEPLPAIVLIDGVLIMATIWWWKSG